ncbi:YitT family protein [Clostridium sp. CX1]|uniref:YitT family protein n=1 Tax=Clostridium sp. CX1 TaxID=2978346 RepID=UPI0021C17DA6|nr:YitT family protein [Clostridium sp. CX1]MCT8978387.1 YitT family protein [Clostridium sp. CX1]
MGERLVFKYKVTDLFFIIIGTIISSIGINMFIIHAKLLSGGVTGIALIFHYLFKIQVGYVILLMNIPLFILSFMKLSKRFTLYSLVGTLSLSLSLIITHPTSKMLNINDNLLYCLYGGVINGIGFGLVFVHNGSTGGFDIVTMLIRKKYSNFNIGKISFLINLVIVSISAFIFGLSNALYTLIAMYTTSFVVDNMVRGFNKSKSVFIITEKQEEIADAILESLHRGVTYFYGEGAYTKEHKKILYCIVPFSQLPKLKQIVTALDDKAFLTISDASEVQGKGFKNTL